MAAMKPPLVTFEGWPLMRFSYGIALHAVETGRVTAFLIVNKRINRRGFPDRIRAAGFGAWWLFHENDR